LTVALLQILSFFFYSFSLAIFSHPHQSFFLIVLKLSGHEFNQVACSKISVVLIDLETT